jgi:pimeloyl-ACP methyl ester carboxylesterase
MPFIATDDGVKIYYEDRGQGKTIVFVHGWTGTGRTNFGFQASYLRSKFRVITYDLRGHGASDRPEHGLAMTRFAQDLEQVMDALDVKDVTLVGWSMGAHILFEYVKVFGCKRLFKAVSVDMTPKLVNDETWRMGLYHGDYDYLDNQKALTMMCDDWESFAEDFLQRLAPDMGPQEFKMMMKLLMANTPHVMYAMQHAMSVVDYRETVAKITVPTLIVYGEKSTLYSAETAQYLKSKIPNSRTVAFEGCGHLLPLEKPDQFSRVIEEFVLESD